MDFVPCPRCQEMNPPNVVKCTACGASMDEEPIEVTPLALAQEPEAEEVAPEPPPPRRRYPPLRHRRGRARDAAPRRVPPLPPAAAPPHATPAAAAAAHVELPADVTAQVAALEQQITARPEAKGLYIKLADLYQHAGQKDAAAAVLERLLGFDPGNALAKHRIDVLRGTVHHAPPAVIGGASRDATGATGRPPGWPRLLAAGALDRPRAPWPWS